MSARGARDRGSRQAIPASLGARGLHVAHPSRARRRPRRSERSGQVHAAQPRCWAARADRRLDHRARRAARARRRPARPRRLRPAGCGPLLRGSRSRTTCASASTAIPVGTTDAAHARLGELGLRPRQRAGRLSGGQRAQLLLTIALAKRPELLLLDEPVASLDPLARREFLGLLMSTVAGHDVSIVLSSHLVSDIERVCDFLIVLVDSRVRVAGEIEELLAVHHRLVGTRSTDDVTPANQTVIASSVTDRQRLLVVRSDGPVVEPGWVIESITLEDLVLAYMGARCGPPGSHSRRHRWRHDVARLAPAAHRRRPLPRSESSWSSSRSPSPDRTSSTSTTPWSSPAPRMATASRSRPTSRGSTRSWRRLCSDLMILAPILFGIFLGAPLVARELEAATVPARLDPERDEDAVGSRPAWCWSPS